jgi:hypothetical protein
MKATLVVLAMSTMFLALQPPAAPAQAVTKINFTTAQPHAFSPVPGKAGPHNKAAWWCASTVGVCLFAYPAYIGMPCQCCGMYGCAPGQISGFSSIGQPDDVANNR